MKTRSMRQAERLSLDRITTLPQPILETILCFLDTREAIRTSILSREWRYKWTTIPKLEFYHYERFNSLCEQISDIASTRKNMGMRCKQSYDMNQILLQHQGPIHELTLDLPEDECLELDQIILHLSKNQPIKKLRLIGWDSDAYWYTLPISVFSFNHVTDLDLRYVDILDHPPIFNGFGSLRSLYLRYLKISTKTLLHLLSGCPSLKSLSLFVLDLDDNCTINELFECLPAIEHLSTWHYVSAWLVLDSVPQELPSSLIHLKYFCFGDMYCLDGYGLAFLLLLIKCSPNLEKIKIQHSDLWDECKEYPVVWEEYSDVWLERLNELEFEWFENTKPEMEFLKFILARSPKLKKVSLCSMFDPIKQSKMYKTLLEAPRVSPVVITVK